MENPFKVVENKLIVKTRADKNIVPGSAIERFIESDFGAEHGRVIRIPRVTPKSFIKNYDFIERSNRVYTNGIREYYGNSSLILVPKEEFKQEDLEAKTQPLGFQKFHEFYLIIYPDDSVTQEAYEILKESDWVYLVDFNFSSIEKVPLDFVRNLSFAERATRFKLPERQEAYEVINVPKSKGKIGNPNIRIAIFDVGMDLKHYDLNVPTNKQNHWDAIADDNNTYPQDFDSHGTLCAGIAAGFRTKKYGVNGVGSGCSLVDFRIGVTGKSKRGYYSVLKFDLFMLIKAFYKAAFEYKVDVISCSWGLGAKFDTLEYIIQKVSKEGRNGLGLPIVFAAGNKGRKVTSPADLDCVVTVSAVDLDGAPILDKNKLKWASNFGDKVDIAAVGTAVITTDMLGNYGVASNYKKNFNYYFNFSGTSAAAPQVAGCIGLMFSINPNLCLTEVKKLLKSQSKEFQEDFDQCYGRGILDVEKVINNLKSKQMSKKEINYSTNIRVAPELGNRSQFIFASQSYQTFYAVYGRFITTSILDDDDNELEDRVRIERIDLELINYKGMINISLEDAQIAKAEIIDDIQFIAINLQVKGAVMHEANKEVSITDFSKIQDQIIFDNCEFEAQRELCSLNGQTWNEMSKDKNPKSSLGGVFDYEFFDRNGKLMPQLKPNYDEIYNTVMNEIPEDEAQLTLGTWCIGTKSVITTK